MSVQWYKDIAFYQIWPRSFADGNGDGIGDLYGVYDKLEYIHSLGIGGIWFSPLYASPQADYGYDIADYYNINPEYGDMDIFRKVLDKAHSMGMKVIMDLVVNHTSDEHEWFKKSRDKSSPYYNYYFWRKGRPGGKMPNNWDSVFSGKAWEYDKEMDEYYLHVFDKKQVDLNMDNPAVRKEVTDIMRYWLDIGVDGFREDVITFISKPEGLRSDILPFMHGLRYYMNGPHLQEYLSQFRTEVLDKYDCFVVGEAPMMTPKKALKFVDERRASHELDMMFHFQHMEADCLFTEYMPMPFSLRKLKKAWTRWQKALGGIGWNALYIENHDHARIISRYGSEKYRVESGKMLACSYLFQQGTPFVYQGQEIGMTNIMLDSIDQYKDCMAINHYARDCRKGHNQKAFDRIRKATRDNSRTVMQWSGEKNGGFSECQPWFAVNPNYTQINVAAQEKNQDSLLNFYRAVLKYRTASDIVRHGSYTEYYKGSRKLYVYGREYEGKRLLVICSFTEKRARFRLPEGFDSKGANLIFGNYPEQTLSGGGFTTRPYEVRVYEFSYNPKHMHVDKRIQAFKFK